MFDFLPTINSAYVIMGSALLGAAGGMLGVFAVLKKQGLLGDALAHTALPGIAIAFLIMEGKYLPGLMLGALISALIGGVGIYLLVRYSKIKMDTAMAAILSVFFGVGVLILTYIQKLPLSGQGGLESFLFGQAASLVRSDVMWMAGAFLFVVAMLVLFWKEMKLFVFDRQYAVTLGFKEYLLELFFMTVFIVTILMALQSVGVVLTAAVFITPAAAALLWSRDLKNVVILAAVFGMLAGMGGAYTSAIVSKMPTGPLIVVFTTLIFFVSFLFAPRVGLISIWHKYTTKAKKVQTENFLAALYRDYEAGNAEVELDQYLGRGYNQRILNYLVKTRLVSINEGLVKLTKAGLKSACGVVERHRLWETYLVNRLRVEPDKVHADAEEMEHVLTDDVVVELKKLLKNPKLDPHGKPIKK